MTKNQINEREQLEMLTIDQLVPQVLLVRKLEAAIDFSFIYPLVENLRHREYISRCLCLFCLMFVLKWDFIIIVAVDWSETHLRNENQPLLKLLFIQHIENLFNVFITAT